MSEKCFCHISDINGNKYVVKDKEARERLDEVEDQLSHLGSTETLAGVNVRLGEIDQALSTHESRIGSLSSGQGTLSARIDGVSQSLSALDARVSSSVSGLKTQITTETAKRVLRKTASGGTYVYAENDSGQTEKKISTSPEGSTIPMRSSSGQLSGKTGCADGELITKGETKTLISNAIADLPSGGSGVDQSVLTRLSKVETTNSSQTTTLTEHSTKLTALEGSSNDQLGRICEVETVLGRTLTRQTVTTGTYLYGENSAGVTTKKLSTSAEASAIPMRSSTGQIAGKEGCADTELITKGETKSLISSAISELPSGGGSGDEMRLYRHVIYYKTPDGYPYSVQGYFQYYTKTGQAPENRDEFFDLFKKNYKFFHFDGAVLRNNTDVTPATSDYLIPLQITVRINGIVDIKFVDAIANTGMGTYTNNGVISIGEYSFPAYEGTFTQDIDEVIV